MNKSVLYILKFLGIFCLLYFGTMGVIAMTSPEGRFHSAFVAKYFDYVSWLKISLMRAPAFILGLFGIATHEEPGFLLRINGGRGVIIAYSCVGYGVYSFWIAFIIANKGKIVRKLKWIFFGVLGLWFINVIRITLFLLAINRGWPMPLGLDHHTWFNIFAYILIFILIFWYDRSKKKAKQKETTFKAVTKQNAV